MVSTLFTTLGYLNSNNVDHSILMSKYNFFFNCCSSVLSFNFRWPAGRQILTLNCEGRMLMWVSTRFIIHISSRFTISCTASTKWSVSSFILLVQVWLMIWLRLHVHHTSTKLSFNIDVGHTSSLLGVSR